ncbi:periphilin-1 isoform X2 [Pseudophryne corroboree]|uniref:periphilin-1 isoform X2 n=1 Tax=Pseudophryne corroboree TaxID=495146 RepID=UPI003081DC90
MEYRKDEMWSEYERLPRHRLPPREIPPDGEYHRVVNVVRRPEDEGCHRYDDYNDPDYRDYEDAHGYERRSGPYRGEDPAYRWPRGDPYMSRHSDFGSYTRLHRATEVTASCFSRPLSTKERIACSDIFITDHREGFRRKPLYHHAYVRDHSPLRRESSYFRESPVTRKDSPHSRSGSSVSSRSYSPDKGKTLASHQHRSKERPSSHVLKSSKDPSPSSSAAGPSTKTVELDKGNRITDTAFVEAACKWISEKMEKVSESNLPEVTEELSKVGSSSALFGDQAAENEANVTGNSELFEPAPLSNRSKAIAVKTKEIEEVYRQDCETFGMVVKMLIDKDPSLEKQVQFALRQNLSEIGERCIEELKLYIAEYDAAPQDLA